MMRARRLTLTVLGVLAGGLVFSSAPAPAASVHGFSSSFGGSGASALSSPSGVAVNEVTTGDVGDVYVVDEGNNRVEQFSATGTFILMFGKEVNKTKVEAAAPEAEQNVCTQVEVEAGEVCQAGTAGSGAGQLDSPEAIAVDNDLSSPSVGDVYVTNTNTADPVIEKFSASGAYLGQIATGEGGAAFEGLCGVAVDAEGKVWVCQYQPNPDLETHGDQIDDYSDALVNEFLLSRHPQTGGESKPGFAVDSEDNLYNVSGYYRRVAKLNSAGELVKNGTEIEYELGGAGPKTGIAVDLANNDAYLDNGSSVSLFAAVGSPIEVLLSERSPIEEFSSPQLLSGSGIAVNSANGTVYVAEPFAKVVDIFALFALPDVTTGALSNIQPQTGSATLNGAVNPVEAEAGSKAKGIEFEYLTEKAFNAEAKTPVNEVQVVTLMPEAGHLSYGGYFTLTFEGETTGSIYYTEEAEEVERALAGLTKIGAGDVTVTGRNGGPYRIEFKGSLARRPVPELTVYSELEGGATAEVTTTTEGSAGGWYTAKTVAAIPAELGGNSPLAVTAEVSGLKLNTVYEYRLNATNATEKINHSPNATFTLGVSPAVDDLPATVTDVGGASAVFQGTVNPENTVTLYHFAYVPAGEYQPGASNPYAGGGATEEVSVPAELGDETVGPVQAGDLLPGTTYDYALVASNAAGSSIGDDHTFTTSPTTPPVATTGGASAISQNSATLSGTVSTNGLQTNYGFEIGTEADNYGPATGLGSLGGATTEAVSVTLSELQPGTTYYYRITATNAEGTVQSAPGTFTTPGFPTLIAPPASPPLVAYTSPGFPANTANTQSPTIAVVSHKVKGKTATIKVSVPAAGKLVATGKGVSKGTGKASKAGDVTVKVSLTKKEQAFLAKHKGRKLKVAVKLSFTPTKGSKLETSVTVLIA